VPAAPKIRAVTFDAGGTLIRPYPSVAAVYAEVAREFGHHCREEVLETQFARAWASQTTFNYAREDWLGIVRQSFAGQAEVSRALFEAIYERFAEPGAWQVFEDARPALENLRQRGVRIAVLSNWDDRLPGLLDRLKLADYFERIFVSAQIGAHKPDVRIFRHAAEYLQIPPEEILHIGDSQREDVEGARAAGLQAVRIRRSGAEQASDAASLLELPGLR